MFVPESQTFETWVGAFGMTFCLGVAEAKLAKNMVNQLAWGSKLSINDLYYLVLDYIPSDNDGAAVLRSIPSFLW